VPFDPRRVKEAFSLVQALIKKSKRENEFTEGEEKRNDDDLIFFAVTAFQDLSEDEILELITKSTDKEYTAQSNKLLEQPTNSNKNGESTDVFNRQRSTVETYKRLGEQAR
jgi:hypothetical protein